jgi:hypothetical protein
MINRMADDDDKEDKLLDKLDGLMRSGRGPRPQHPPPVLTDAVPQPRAQAIPTLTDVVESDEAGAQVALDPERTDLDSAIASRLVASVDREMASLSKVLPAHRYKLAVLHRSLRFALPELVRLRWQDQLPEDEDDIDASGSDMQADSRGDTV